VVLEEFGIFWGIVTSSTILESLTSSSVVEFRSTDVGLVSVFFSTMIGADRTTVVASFSGFPFVISASSEPCI